METGKIKKYQVKSGTKVLINPSNIICAFTYSTYVTIYLLPANHTISLVCSSEEEAKGLLKLIEKDILK